MSNVSLASEILRQCWQRGVREVVICAGARNAPFVSVLSERKSLTVHPFFEERSAGFFALGKILASQRPVAVITTSGTAAAELLPAMIEADYQGLPLIAITADRPRRYRGSGAPQTINQIGLYSHYVEKSWDIEGASREHIEWSLARPIHINVCFDEPLIDAALEPLKFSDEEMGFPSVSAATELVSLKMRAPLVIVGGLPLRWREVVATKLREWQRPVYLEAHSNLRGREELRGSEILGGEKSLAQLEYDGVIRIGSVPTLRLWRDLENQKLPVAHFSQISLSGLPREPMVFPLESLSSTQCEFSPWRERERERDLFFSEKRRALLREFSLSEPAWVEWLSHKIPARARIFLGNSLPIREWDFASALQPRHEIFANRGVNGIDGLISTFMGLAQPEKSNWCVIGDLSALYDLSGPWANQALQMRDLNVVIINNGGGKIFHRLFRNPLFENPHQLHFKAWAEMWGWSYVRLEHELPRELPPTETPRVIEIVPDNAQTEAFWNAWEKIT